MGFAWAIIIGFVAGAIAKLIMPGKDPGGCIITILLGIGGAMLFTFLGRLAGIYGQSDSAGIIGAIFGAIIILWIYKVAIKKKSKS